MASGIRGGVFEFCSTASAGLRDFSGGHCFVFFFFYVGMDFFLFTATVLIYVSAVVLLIHE